LSNGLQLSHDSIQQKFCQAFVLYEDIGNTLTPREFTRISSLPMPA